MFVSKIVVSIYLCLSKPSNPMCKLHGPVVSALGIHDTHLTDQSLHRRPMLPSSTATVRIASLEWCALINARQLTMATIVL